jgi:hypothetical protein
MGILMAIKIEALFFPLNFYVPLLNFYKNGVVYHENE